MFCLSAGRPPIFSEASAATEIRLPTRLRERIGDDNVSRVIATSLERFFDLQEGVAKALDDKDVYKANMERLAQEVVTLRSQRVQLVQLRKEFADHKRSLTQTLRECVGEGRAKAMGLYRRCSQAIVEQGESISQIDERLKRIAGAAG